MTDSQYIELTEEIAGYIITYKNKVTCTVADAHSVQYYTEKAHDDFYEVVAEVQQMFTEAGVVQD